MLFTIRPAGDLNCRDRHVWPREEVPLSEEEERERQEVVGKVEEVQSRARQLLAVWAQLQEMFRIPKRERHKIRVEHEREADRQDWHSDR